MYKLSLAVIVSGCSQNTIINCIQKFYICTDKLSFFPPIHRIIIEKLYDVLTWFILCSIKLCLMTWNIQSIVYRSKGLQYGCSPLGSSDKPEYSRDY